MIIVMGNSYPQCDRYVQSYIDSHDGHNRKDFQLVWNEKSANKCWSIEAKELRIITIIDWLNPEELFNLIRRLRINR